MSKTNASDAQLIKRASKWADSDPSTLFTKRIEKATQPIQALVTLLLPEILIAEVAKKTLWAAETLVNREEVLKDLGVTDYSEIKENVKLGKSDHFAESTHNWAIASAAALGAWDIAGPLGIAPSLVSIFTLAFRTIKKIGAYYGYDTASAREEAIVLEIFVAGSGFFFKDKLHALKAIEKAEYGDFKLEDVQETLHIFAQPISSALVRRRALTAIPGMGALIGTSTNAWLLRDIGWAARNIYVMRRQREQDAKLNQTHAA